MRKVRGSSPLLSTMKNPDCRCNRDFSIKSASRRDKSTLRVGEIADAMISACGRMADLISPGCKADGFHPSKSEDFTVSEANDFIILVFCDFPDIMVSVRM